MPHDAAFAVRQLRRSPVFTAAAVLTLALAIGANTAIFQVLDAVVFRTLPVRDPGRLVRVTLLENGKPRYFSYPEFRELAARQESADLIATSDFRCTPPFCAGGVRRAR